MPLFTKSHDFRCTCAKKKIKYKGYKPRVCLLLAQNCHAKNFAKLLLAHELVNIGKKNKRVGKGTLATIETNTKILAMTKNW